MIHLIDIILVTLVAATYVIWIIITEKNYDKRTF